jgi:hypothetical protein
MHEVADKPPVDLESDQSVSRAYLHPRVLILQVFKFSHVVHHM